MYRLINENSEDVIAELRRLDVATYLNLRMQLLSGDAGVPFDLDFQRQYRSYWRMNVARLPQSFYHRYFELLAGQNGPDLPDLNAITRGLSKADVSNRQSLQFSFATKLAHMIDPRLPIYDRFVAAFYFFTPPSPEKPFEERLSSLLTFYDFLRTEHARVISGKLLSEAVTGFRTRYGVGEAVCDERIVDWLLWGWVSLLRRGAQRSGIALYS